MTDKRETMTLFRLRIPENIKSVDAWIITAMSEEAEERGTDIDYFTFNENLKSTTKWVLDFTDIPKDWLEEIPAKPKYLSAEEYAKTTHPRNNSDCQHCWIQGVRNGFEAGEKQGIRKGKEERDADYQPLVEKIKHFVKFAKDSGWYNVSTELEEALKNIKPLDESST